MGIFGKDKEEKVKAKGAAVEKPGEEQDEEEMKYVNVIKRFEEYAGDKLTLRIEQLKAPEDYCGVQVHKSLIKTPEEMDGQMDAIGEKVGGILMANVRTGKGFYIVSKYQRTYPLREVVTAPTTSVMQPPSGGGELQSVLAIMVQQSKEREDRERERDEREREREERRREELRLEREERAKENQALLRAMSEQSQKMHESMQSSILEINKMILQMVMSGQNKKEDVLDVASKIKGLMGDGKESMQHFMEMFTLVKGLAEGKEPEGGKSITDVLGDVLKKIAEGMTAQAGAKQEPKIQPGAGATGGEVKAMELKASNMLEAFIIKHRGELYQAIVTPILSEYEKGRGLVQAFYQDVEFTKVDLPGLRTMITALPPERVIEIIPQAKGNEAHVKAILQQAEKYVLDEMAVVSQGTPVAENPEPEDDK